MQQVGGKKKEVLCVLAQQCNLKMEPAQAHERVWMLRAQTQPHPHPLGAQDAAGWVARGLPHPAHPSPA